MSIVKRGWLAAIPYLFAVIGMFIASYYSLIKHYIEKIHMAIPLNRSYRLL